MNNPYNFEQFTAYGSKFSSKISLGRSGGFGFSSGFYNQHNLGKSVAIRMFFDKSKMAVGFEFFKEPVDQAVKLKGPEGSGVHITAQSFLKKYGIDPLIYSGKYDPIEVTGNDGNKIYVIELKKKTDKTV